MKRKNIKRYGKALVISVLVAAAGFSHSCGAAGKGELLSASEGDGQREAGAGLPGGQDASDEPGALSGQDALDVPGTLAGRDTSDVSEAFVGQDSLDVSGAVSCFVHVCGQVENPGVYELKEGQRVFEAIEMAGGFSDKAAEDYLNLAEPVWDGMRLEVPDREQAPDTEWVIRTGDQAGAGQPGSHRENGQPGSRAKAGVSSDSGSSPSSGKVNLNTATKEELMTLRGIGEARAEDIIRYREERGGFGRIEDIMEISGIKDAAFQKIKDDIIV